MACRSASVQRAQIKSNNALEAIKRLENDIENLAQAEETDFENKISKNQNDLGIDDLEKVDGNFATKVDFTHEFNADALIPVITNVLNTAATLIAGSGAAAILTNPENIKTYADLLSSIAEAIKTKSTTGANTSFSMNRLAPGFFSFTSTKAMTITDKETFGEESVTATTFHYALYFSKKHAIKMGTWNTILSVLEVIRKLNEARIGLVDRLIKNDYTLAEFSALSEHYKLAIEKHESELSILVYEKSVVGVTKKAKMSYPSTVEVNDVLYNHNESIDILTKAAKLLGSRGSLYAPALRETKDLLNSIKSES